MERKALKAFNNDEIDGAKGRTGIAQISKTRHPQIKDRRAFVKYILKHRALDLLQNRIASKAYFDRLEEGDSVPGVEVYEHTKVRVRARK